MWPHARVKFNIWKCYTDLINNINSKHQVLEIFHQNQATTWASFNVLLLSYRNKSTGDAQRTSSASTGPQNRSEYTVTTQQRRVVSKEPITDYHQLAVQLTIQCSDAHTARDGQRYSNLSRYKIQNTPQITDRAVEIQPLQLVAYLAASEQLTF